MYTRRLRSLVMLTGIGLLGSALVLVPVGSASASAEPQHRPAKAFTSCTALNAKYSTGVARDAKARTAAVAAGYQVPVVSRTTYLENRARLDRDGDGVACPIKAVDPIVPPDPAFAATADAVAAAGATCMVARKNGQVIGEWYWSGRKPTTATTGFSTLKALAGTLVGIAQTQGKLNIDQPASDFITEWKGTPSASVTIRQLLNMTSGRATGPMDAQEMVMSPDATAYAISKGQAATPGTVFQLSDSAVQTLGRVLSVATGQPVLQFAKANLMDPLGMSSTTLVPDGSQSANLAFNYTTTCRDLSRLAQLYVNGGSWQGRQILSADYVNQARTGSAANPGYGFLFNLNAPGASTYYAGAPSDAFSLIGDCGQVSEAFPSSGLVLTAMTSSDLFDALTCDPTGARVSAISQAFAAAPR